MVQSAHPPWKSARQYLIIVWTMLAMLRGQAVFDHSQERRVAMSVVIKLLQPPALRSVIEVLLEAVTCTQPGRRRCVAWPAEENCPFDVSLAAAHHTRDQARRLKPLEAFLAYGGVQSAGGEIDGD